MNEMNSENGPEILYYRMEFLLQFKEKLANQKFCANTTANSTVMNYVMHRFRSAAKKAKTAYKGCEFLRH